MKHETVRATALAMPLTNPAFPPGPYRFINREYFIIQVLRMQKIRLALQRTIEKLPESAKQDPEIRAIADMARHRSCNIIHLIYQSKLSEGQSKDYEFGLNAMRVHWQSGLDDIHRTLADPRRLDRPAPELGIVTHDVHRRD